MKNLKLLFVLTLFAAFISCSKGKEPVPEVIVPEVKVDPKGKFVITSNTAGPEQAFIFDIRDNKAPKKLTYNFSASKGKFELTNTIALGVAGGLARHSNWPVTWTNIKLIAGAETMVLNMDNKLLAFDYVGGGYVTVVKTEDLYPFPSNWKNVDKLGGGCIFKEAYSNTTSNTMGFYFDFATGDYLYAYDQLGTSPSYYQNYKISDLLKKTNGNVDVDPIDWSKSDLVFCFDNVYANKPVTQFVFIDLDNNTYASFVRNKNDDPVKGADAGRQTLLTTKWEPILNLFETWPIK